MKRQPPKLQINAKTVRQLTPEALKDVRGGGLMLVKKIGTSALCNNSQVGGGGCLGF